MRSKSGEKRKSGFPLKNRMGKEAWSYARVYGFVMKNPKQVGKGKPDNDLFLETKSKYLDIIINGDHTERCWKTFSTW